MQQFKNASHDYIIAHIRPAEAARAQLGDIIWMRAERRPSSKATLLNMSRGDMPAQDTAQLSYYIHRLREHDDTVWAETVFRELEVVHLMDLLRTVGSVEEDYHLFKGEWVFR